MANLLAAPEDAEDVLAVMRNVMAQFSLKDLEKAEAVEVPLPVKLWRVCHELLASLGFDLMEVGRDEVTLRTNGKQANKRNIQFAHQALLALFGEYTFLFSSWVAMCVC